MEPGMKSKPVAYLLWFFCFFGIAGVHRFYLGKWVTGIIWFCTFGLLGIGQLIDFFTLSGQVDVKNAVLVGRSMTGGGVRGRRRADYELDREPTFQSRSSRKKNCPECAEPIQLDARKCRFCGTDLTVNAEGDSELTICDCPECGHILEVPTHLVGVAGRCTHCDEVITPYAPAPRSEMA